MPTAVPAEPTHPPAPVPDAPDADRAELLRRLRGLAVLSPARFCVSLALDWVVIIGALAAAAAFPNVVVLVAAVFVIGTRQQGLAILGHEAVHRLVSRNRRFNDTVGMAFCFWPLAGSMTGFRRFHLAHHKHLGTDKDPEVDLYAGDRWKLPTARGEATKLLLLDCLGLNLRGFVKFLARIQPESKYEYAGMVAWWLGFAGVCWAVGYPWLVLLYAAAIPTVLWATMEFRGRTEHRGIAETHRFELGRVFQALLYPHKIWLHHEHHRWCFVPFYRLEEARLLDESTPVVSLGEVLAFLESREPDAYAQQNGHRLQCMDFREPPASASNGVSDHTSTPTPKTADKPGGTSPRRRPVRPRPPLMPW